MDQEKACRISENGGKGVSTAVCSARIGVELAIYRIPDGCNQDSSVLASTPSLLRAFTVALMNLKHHSEIGTPFTMIEVMDLIEMVYGKPCKGPLFRLTGRPDYFLSIDDDCVMTMMKASNMVVTGWGHTADLSDEALVKNGTDVWKQYRDFNVCLTPRPWIVCRPFYVSSDISEQGCPNFDIIQMYSDDHLNFQIYLTSYLSFV